MLKEGNSMFIEAGPAGPGPEGAMATPPCTLAGGPPAPGAEVVGMYPAVVGGWAAPWG